VSAVEGGKVERVSSCGRSWGHKADGSGRTGKGKGPFEVIEGAEGVKRCNQNQANLRYPLDPEPSLQKPSNSCPAEDVVEESQSGSSPPSLLW